MKVHYNVHFNQKARRRTDKSAVCSREVRNTAIRGGTDIYNALSKRSEVVVDAARMAGALQYILKTLRNQTASTSRRVVGANAVTIYVVLTLILS